MPCPVTRKSLSVGGGFFTEGRAVCTREAPEVLGGERDSGALKGARQTGG